MSEYSKITALYSRMMEDVESGKISVCIMKDLKRWGTTISKQATLWR